MFAVPAVVYDHVPHTCGYFIFVDALFDNEVIDIRHPCGDLTHVFCYVSALHPTHVYHQGPDRPR